MKIENLQDMLYKLYINFGIVRGSLDFQNKVNEDVEILQPYVTDNTNYTAVYTELMTSRKTLPTGNILPVIIEALENDKNNQKTNMYINDSENGKMMLFICYKDGVCREIREYVIQNGGYDTNTKTRAKVLKDLNDRYGYIKVMEFPENAVLYRDLLKFDENGEKIVGGEIWEIGGYDSNGDVAYYNKTRIA